MEKLVKVLIKISKDAAKDISKLGDTVVKTVGKKLVTNKTVGAGAIAAGTSAAVRNENKK